MQEKSERHGLGTRQHASGRGQHRGVEGTKLAWRRHSPRTRLTNTANLISRWSHQGRADGVSAVGNRGLGAALGEYHLVLPSAAVEGPDLRCSGAQVVGGYLTQDVQALEDRSGGA